MKFKTIIISLLFFMGSLANVANAGLIEFNWNWTGSAGYTATGMFGYSDTLDNTGVITAGSIDVFTIEAFSSTTSLFTWDLATGTQTNPFRLSFDTTLEKIVFGGAYPTASDAVVWGNDNHTGSALICGTAKCAIDDSALSGSFDVTHTSEQFILFRIDQKVPEPATIAIFTLGMIGLASRRFNKQ